MAGIRSTLGGENGKDPLFSGSGMMMTVALRVGVAGDGAGEALVVGLGIVGVGGE